MGQPEREEPPGDGCWEGTPPPRLPPPSGNSSVFCPYPSYRQEKPERSQIIEPPLLGGRSVGIRVSRNNLKQPTLAQRQTGPECGMALHGDASRPPGSSAGRPKDEALQPPPLSCCSLCLILLYLVVLIKGIRNGKRKCQQGGQGRPPSLPPA